MTEHRSLFDVNQFGPETCACNTVEESWRPCPQPLCERPDHNHTRSVDSLLSSIEAGITSTSLQPENGEVRAEALRAARELRATFEACRTVVELYGLRWAKDEHYYAAWDSLGWEADA